MRLSIVVPVFNELENVNRMHRQLTDVLQPSGYDYEIIFVDDGSTDGSRNALGVLADSDSAVKVVFFRRNYGQTAAMQAGIEYASGNAIVTLDGDLQNDPADIPMMVRKFEEGYDLVHGWRKQRQDAWLSRKLPSKIANWLISKATKVPVHDLGCTLKVIRTDIAKELKLYGQMHRFIPILASQHGARCAEVVTNHRARQFGESKYGIARTIQVILDLMTVKYLQNYFANPMKLFGRLALLCGAVSAASAFGTITMKIFGQTDITGNPLFLTAVVCFLAGLQFISLGLLGEVSARIYYSSEHNSTFTVDRTKGFDTNQDRSGTKQAA